MRILQLKLPSGERLPILLEPGSAVPDFWAMLYVLVRARRLAQNTITNHLHAVRHLRAWERYHGRDLATEFHRGRFLSEGDIRSLADHCAYDTEAFRLWTQHEMRCAGGRHATAFPKNVLDIPVSAPIPVVSPHTQYHRMTVVTWYVDFVARATSRAGPRAATAHAEIRRMVATLQNNRPRASPGRTSSRRDHISASAFEQFRSFAHPAHASNPFRSDEVKLRNHVIVSLSYELGLRPGEILALWVEDIDTGPYPTVQIERRHNHPLDPREHQAVAKTQPRLLRISDELAAAVYSYVQIRSHHPIAESHPILFVAAKPPWSGHPLARKSFDNIYRSLANQNPDDLSQITPHAMRHDRACRLADQIASNNKKASANKSIKPIVEGEFTTLLMDYFGWTNPHSARAYLRRFNKDRIDEALDTYRSELAPSGVE
ncbi:MAG: site-specific integrase [Alphaproteobacteria bacterium]|nr:site-specific integrase [Alphaproteobacteria bacterium]